MTRAFDFSHLLVSLGTQRFGNVQCFSHHVKHKYCKWIQIRILCKFYEVILNIYNNTAYFVIKRNPTVTQVNECLEETCVEFHGMNEAVLMDPIIKLL